MGDGNTCQMPTWTNVKVEGEFWDVDTGLGTCGTSDLFSDDVTIVKTDDVGGLSITVDWEDGIQRYYVGKFGDCFKPTGNSQRFLKRSECLKEVADILTCAAKNVGNGTKTKLEKNLTAVRELAKRKAIDECNSNLHNLRGQGNERNWLSDFFAIPYIEHIYCSPDILDCDAYLTDNGVLYASDKETPLGVLHYPFALSGIHFTTATQGSVQKIIALTSLAIGDRGALPPWFRE